MPRASPPPSCGQVWVRTGCRLSLYLICISAGMPIGARLSEVYGNGDSSEDRKRFIVLRIASASVSCFFSPSSFSLSRFAKIVTAMASVARCMRVARPSALSAFRQTTCARPIHRFNAARSFSVTAISTVSPPPSPKPAGTFFFFNLDPFAWCLTT